MRDVYVIGAGMTHFGKFPEVSAIEHGAKAAWEAVKDANINPSDIQVAYCGNAMGGIMTGQECCIGQLMLRDAGIRGIPIMRIENACASGSSALHEAWLMVGSGIYEVAMAVGAEKLTSDDPVRSLSALAAATDLEAEGSMGATFPGIYAMVMSKHMELYGTTREQLARVAVKNYKHGSLNPRSQYRKQLTIEEVISSRIISYPLRRLDCCPIGDGAAAVVVASGDFAKSRDREGVLLAASALTTGMRDGLDDITSSDTTARAARQAYEMAGLGPEDIDVAEVHDCFTVAEIIHYEDLGFCPKGEGGRFMEEGRSSMGGAVVVNPSGGLLAKGHPVGATGIAQICELYWQLQGDAAQRQVEGAKVGLSLCQGGFFYGDCGSAVIHILKK